MFNPHILPLQGKTGNNVQLQASTFNAQLQNNIVLSRLSLGLGIEFEIYINNHLVKLSA